VEDPTVFKVFKVENTTNGPDGKLATAVEYWDKK